MDIFAKLKDLNFPLGQYVVVGGVMAAHHIREAHDLDILVTPVLYQRLLGQGYEQCRCEQCLSTSRLMLKKRDVDILPSYMFGNYIGDTTKLIEEADIIDGFPFIKLTEFVKFKRELGRPKDFEDIRIIEAYLDNDAISMKSSLPQILIFSHVLFNLKNLLRFKGMPYWEDADWERWDSVAEHSYRMAMLAIMLEAHLQSPINLLHTLKLILIHDVVELVTSDYSPIGRHKDAGGHAFDPNAFLDKYERETAAAKHIFGQIGGDLGKEFEELFLEYINTKARPEKTTPEGKFAYALDKIEAVIQIIDWRSIKNNWSREHYDKSIAYMMEWTSYDKGLVEFCKLLKIEGLKCVV